MDITVIIPSRGRIRGLSAALNSLYLLESGKHKVTYGVCCDSDDPETARLCEQSKADMPLAHRVGPRPRSLGGLVDDMALRMPADVYVALTDHCVCISPNWDDIIAREVEQTPHGVFWWKNAMSGDVLLAIVTEKWRAAAGRIFTDDYPYWFDDLCLFELWTMATDMPCIISEALMAHKATNTHRMRDLPFWHDFFNKTRPARVAAGKEIAKRLGLPTPIVGQAYAEKLTNEIMLASSDGHLERIQEGQGDKAPPDENYIAAKSRAEEIMRTL